MEKDKRKTPTDEQILNKVYRVKKAIHAPMTHINEGATLTWGEVLALLPNIKDSPPDCPVLADYFEPVTDEDVLKEKMLKKIYEEIVFEDDADVNSEEVLGIVDFFIKATMDLFPNYASYRTKEEFIILVKKHWLGEKNE